MFFKTKYYPVDIHSKIIYDDPQRTEGKCSVSDKYRGKGIIGIKGQRLNTFECYKEFKIMPA